MKIVSDTFSLRNLIPNEEVSDKLLGFSGEGGGEFPAEDANMLTAPLSNQSIFGSVANPFSKSSSDGM